MAKVGAKLRYDPSMCDRLPQMFANGESVTEVAVELGIHRKTFYDWCNNYPEFKEAYEKGIELSEAWWLRLGRAGALGKTKVNPVMWIFNMKNRFKWRDVSDITSGDKPINSVLKIYIPKEDL